MAIKKPFNCTELIARVVALEANLKALRQVLDERDERYKLRATSQDAAVKTAMDAAEKALIKAEAATERRLEALNELRTMASDQAALYLPRQEFGVQHTSLMDKIGLNENRISEMQRDISAIQARGSGVKDAWGYIIAIIMAGIALATYLHHN